MATRSRYEEAIRVYVEAAGDEELQRLVDSFGDLGDVADFQGNIAKRALDGVAKAAENIGKVDAFSKLKRDLVQTEAQLKEAQAGAQALFREFREGDTSNPQIVRAQRDARKAVSDLQQAVQGQRLALQGLRRELAAGGLDTRNLGTAQAALKGQMSQARQALADSAKSVQQFRAESARAAREVPAGNREIARSYTLIERGLGRLRGVVAGAAAFLGLREAAQGIKGLLGIGAAAENAQRALGNLWGSQAAGNRALEELRHLSKANGLVFADVLDDAKKLKAFGLDPLGGAYQALVDQNAAVGGSQQDLSGKVLALGQAWAKQKLQGEEILQLVERGVPVWSLLEKATGKNVAELQKLSEQGKLGRGVITALYEEIGRANSGAANRGLTGLTGLIAQSADRWQGFLRSVADAGVTDYFKGQIQSLLDSTGGLDGLAQRVASGIIGTLEAIRQLGQQLAPIAKGLGGVVLALARNAEVLFTVAKGWVALKAAQAALNFVQVATSVQATTAALTAQQAAVAATGARFGGLAGILARMPRLIPLTVQAVGIGAAIEGVTQLIRVRNEYVASLESLQASERRVQVMQQDNLQLGRDLQRTYAAYADTVVLSAGEIQGKTRDQAEAYRFALESARKYYQGVVKEAVSSGTTVEASTTAALRNIEAALAATGARLAELGTKAATESGVDAFVNKAVAKFDELALKGKAVKTAVNGLFDGIDLTSADGVQKAADILEQVSIRGNLAAQAVRTELRSALAEVSDQDLPKLKAAAEQAFGAGSGGAKAFAEAVNTINLQRLGVDIEQIETGFSKAGRAAVDQFRAANSEVQKLGLDAAQRATAIAQAFDNAFKQASTKAELQALRQAMQEAVSAGNIGFVEFQRRVAAVDAKLAELAGTGQQMGAVIADGAGQASDALSDVAVAAGRAADNAARAGDSAANSGDLFADASGDAREYALAVGSVSEEFLRAASAANRYAGTQLFIRSINRVTEEHRAQQEALAAQTAEIEKQLADYDELGSAVAKLRQQYRFLGDDQLRGLAEKQRQLQKAKDTESAERQRQTDEARRAAEAGSQVGANATAFRRSGAQPGSPVRETFRFVLPNGDSAELEGSAEAIDSVADLLRQLQTAQSTNTRKRRPY